MSERGNSDILFEEYPSAAGPALAVITLHAEKSLNAITLDMAEQMLAKLKDWRQRSDIACVFIHGAGSRAFCAGGDIRALYRSAVVQPGGPCDYAEDFFETEYRMNHALHQFDKPVVVWGHGIVMGGGLGIFAAGSYRIVTAETRMAMPEVSIGLYPDVGGSYFLNRMPGSCGLFLGVTGAEFNAADALYLGLAETFIEDNQRHGVLQALRQTAWSSSVGDNHERVLELMRPFIDASQAARPEGNVAAAQGEIDRLCAIDDEVELVETLSRTRFANPWLQRASERLAAGSPLSARLIVRQLRQNAGAKLRSIFQSELVLSTHIVRGREFTEGVRALLIDKDRQPHWQYPNAAAVPEAVVAAHFNLPWSEHPLADL